MWKRWIAWVLRHPQMTSALIGDSKVSQVEDCAGAVRNLNFTADELTAADIRPIWVILPFLG